MNRPTYLLIPFACLTVLVGLDAKEALAQGGGNANATGIAIENMTNSAASASEQAAAEAAAAAAAEAASRSEMSNSSSSESGSYDGSDPYGSGYDGSGGYGSQLPVGASGAARAQAAMSAGMMQIARGLASFFAPSEATEELRLDRLTLREQAALAFYLGDQRKALALFHAHVVADGDAANEARNAMQFSRLLKRPLWAIRFGVSLHPRVPSQLADDPEPVREGMQVTGVAIRGGRPGGGYEGGERSEQGPPEEFDNGEGSMEREMEMGMGMAAKPSVVTTLGGEATADVNKTMDVNLGLLAEVVKAQFLSRQNSGQYGIAFNGMETAGQSLAAKADNVDAQPSGLPMWIPGVDFVGEGAVNDMVAEAKKNEIDLLFHFDIIVKENRLGSPSYTARCKLLNVSSGETIGLSKAIDKYEIAGKRIGIRASVEEQVANLFEIMDSKVAVEKMPTLQSTHAVARIESLLGSSNPSALRNLAEMMAYRSRDLITQEQLDKALFYAGGEDALLLIHDEETKRYEKVNEMIERELSGSK